MLNLLYLLLAINIGQCTVLFFIRLVISLLILLLPRPTLVLVNMHHQVFFLLVPRYIMLLMNYCMHQVIYRAIQFVLYMIVPILVLTLSYHCVQYFWAFLVSEPIVI